jgi:DNA polymerase III subunit gamma/tau
MSQAYYRKWRPRQWEQVIGQDHIVKTLQNAVRGGHIGHAYLFAGPRGTGKTTTARLLAKAVNCEDPDPTHRPCDQCSHCLAVNNGSFLDLIEIDAASNTSVDDVRELRDKINYSPSRGGFKVYIIDEVHMLSTAAFNALLKTLEEPPPHAIFILATTEVHKIPATVLSRCQRHEFRRIPVKEIVQYLQQKAADEKIVVEPDALILIARQATGSMRDAISLLDQLASTGTAIDLLSAQTVLGTATTQAVVDLVDAIIDKRTADGFNCISQALDAGSDPRQFARQVVEYLRSVLLTHLGNANLVETTPEIRKQIEAHAKGMGMEQLVNAIRLFNTAATESRSGWQPNLQLELALAELAAPLPGAGQPSVNPSAQAPSVAEIPITPAARTAVQAVATAKIPALPPAPSANKPAVPTSKSSTAADEKAQEKPASVNAPSQLVQSVSTSSLGEIQTAWERIKALVKKGRPSTEALLNSCRLLAFKDGTLTLGFDSEIVRSKMDGKENLEYTCNAIRQVTGSDIHIACVVSAKTTSSPVDLGIEGDGMVGTALNLGGRIVKKGKEDQ